MIKITRQRHVEIPDDNPDFTQPRQVITHVAGNGPPRFQVEKWTACKCSDGPCEQGRMTYYKITIEQSDLTEMANIAASLPVAEVSTAVTGEATQEAA